MTLWKTSITSKLLEIGNSFFSHKKGKTKGRVLVKSSQNVSSDSYDVMVLACRYVV